MVPRERGSHHRITQLISEATNFSNDGKRPWATDADIGQDDAQGDVAADLALAGLTNLATTDNSDIESIASTFLHRAIMNTEQR